MRIGKRQEGARPWRLSAKLLIASSLATVIGFSAVCASVMLDMRRSEEQLARQMLENLAASDQALSPDRKLAARDLVEKLLAMLKPMERLVIDMLYLQERSVAEIQKVTGWTAAAIKIKAFRARQKLRKQIGGLL